MQTWSLPCTDSLVRLAGFAGFDGALTLMSLASFVVMVRLEGFASFGARVQPGGFAELVQGHASRRRPGAARGLRRARPGGDGVSAARGLS